MPNRKITISIVLCGMLVAIIFISMNFDFRLDRFGNSKISWVDCVQLSSIKYYRDNSKSIVEASSIVDKIGEVTFNVAGKVSNSKYRFRDGDATFLDVGTEIYGINKTKNAIAVKVGEKYYLYNTLK